MSGDAPVEAPSAAEKVGEKRAAAEGAAEVQEDAKASKVAPPKPKTSFRGIAGLVVAMNRWKNSINPTYSYGKRTTSTGSGGPPSRKATTTGTEVDSARPASPPPAGSASSKEHYAYADHGHRFDLLMKPLPPTEDEEAGSQ